MKCVHLHKILKGICAAMLVLAPSSAQAQDVRISKLTDAAFGTISIFTTDLTPAQDICVYHSKPKQSYSITATGGGGAGRP